MDNDQVVAQKGLIVTADAQASTYGDAAITIGNTEFSTSGLVNSETVGTATLATTVDNTTAAGTATNAVTASSVTGGTFTAGNYEISYVDNDQVVAQKGLIVTADADTYDHSHILTFGQLVSGSGSLILGNEKIPLEIRRTWGYRLESALASVTRGVSIFEGTPLWAQNLESAF